MKNLKRKNKKNQKGQVLVMLLVFMTVGIIITSAAIVIAIVNSQSSSRFSMGELAYSAAESGVENAILKVNRNPNYTGETGMIIGNGTVDITVSGTTTKTIVSVATVGNYVRTIQATGNYEDFILTPSTWIEIE